MTFLMIARLLRYKGVVEFCEAAREVRKTSSQCPLHTGRPGRDGARAD